MLEMCFVPPAMALGGLTRLADVLQSFTHHTVSLLRAGMVEGRGEAWEDTLCCHTRDDHGLDEAKCGRQAESGLAGWEGCRQNRPTV